LLQVSTFIAASAIEGVGVFAAEPIRKGTMIWRSDERFDLFIPIAEYRDAPHFLRQLFERYAYPSPDRPGFLVYEVDNGRFMNHADNPNTDFSGVGGWATADIAAGEEITCNYAEFYENFEAALAAGDRPHGFGLSPGSANSA
jgi:SET domain-containing protein